MTADPKGRDLFIVDNSVSGWTGLRYLDEWAGIAKSFDIATGYFEIGALLALDGKWQPLDKFRILLGAEMTNRTRQALLQAVRARAVQMLDTSIEADKGANPFLHGVPAILEALRSGQIECRVYDKDKFHAKAYITHAKLEVVGAQALVGSSNFTAPGLTKNIELNRADVIQRFWPYYNTTSSPALAERGRTEIRVLISTDILSEGLNLQDASRMIDYDIHWNPVRPMQRIGRVDRRMNPDVEERLVADHPEVASSRGKVSFWNFLPPDELNAILTLYTKVTQKTLLISRTLGIEGKKLLTPADDYEALKEFNHAYEGTKTAVEDMHLEYQALLQADPELEARLARLPGATFSGRKRPAKGALGVFFCYALPTLDKEVGEFTEEAGTTRWYLYDLDRDAILEEPGEIVASIRSKPETPRTCTTEEKTLVESRAKVEKHIKNTHLKRVDAPVGVKPALRCWMELN